MKSKIVCATCGAEFERYASQRGRFCSRVCWGREMRVTRVGESALRYKHGGTGTRLHRIWKGMKARCHNSRFPGYENYGARGIAVCENWRTSYIAFRDWAVSNGYSDELEIDRANNGEGYRPENCRWVTRRENSRNKRTSRNTPAMRNSVLRMARDGVIYRHIAERLGISRSTVFRAMKDVRLKSGGWDIEEVLP